MQVAFALCHFHIGAGLIKLLLQFLHGIHAVFFRVPCGAECVGLFFQISQFDFHRFQPVLAGCIVFLAQGFALNFELDNPAVQFVQFFRLAINLHPQAAGGLINQINGFVGQEPVGNITV